MSDLDTRMRFLQTVPLFQGLDERQLNRLAKRFNERSFNKGETIVNQGTLGIGLFIVVTGSADAVRAHPDGSTSVVNHLEPKNFFGELSLLEDAPRTASVVAVEDSTCLVLTQLDFMSALKEDSDMAISMLKEMARRFRRMMEAM